MIALALTLGVVAVAALVALMIALRSREPMFEDRPASAERDSRPEALLDAELIYVEKVLRVSRPVGLIARIDRGYRMRSGVIVLMEFKSRWINRPFLADVVQLSAQKLALEGQLRQRVAQYGYVVVKTPSKAGHQTAHRVELMPRADVLALIKRREDILAGRVVPHYTESPAICRTCAFRAECDSPHLP